MRCISLHCTDECTQYSSTLPLSGDNKPLPLTWPLNLQCCSLQCSCRRLAPTLCSQIYMQLCKGFIVNSHLDISPCLSIRTHLQSEGCACLVNTPGCDFCGHWNSAPSSSTTTVLLHSGTWPQMSSSSLLLSSSSSLFIPSPGLPTYTPCSPCRTPDRVGTGT